MSRALGEEVRVRMSRSEREGHVRTFDPDDEDDVQAFVEEFEEKLGGGGEEAVHVQSRRTDWREFDQQTRSRKGMRGVGDAKGAVSSSDRRAAKKKRSVWALRDQYRNITAGVGDAGGHSNKWGRGERGGQVDERDFVADVMEGWEDDEDDEDDEERKGMMGRSKRGEGEGGHEKSEDCVENKARTKKTVCLVNPWRYKSAWHFYHVFHSLKLAARYESQHTTYHIPHITYHIPHMRLCILHLTPSPLTAVHSTS